MRERCLLVLQCSRANQDLRATAERLLKRDETARQHAAAQRDAASAFRQSTWACTECSLLNAADAAVCAACSQPKPLQKWICPHCTCVNPGDQSCCEACERPSHAAAQAKAKRQKQTRIDQGRVALPVWDAEAEEDFQPPPVRPRKGRS